MTNVIIMREGKIYKRTKCNFFSPNKRGECEHDIHKCPNHVITVEHDGSYRCISQKEKKQETLF